MKKSMRIIINAFMIVSLGSILSNCNKEDEQPQPSISSFTPTSGLAGDQVTISGENFSDVASALTVQFNGTNADVSSSSKTELIVTIPAGATTGKITVGINGKTATSTSDFTVFLLQTITSFSPESGLEGSSVTITGTNFDTTPANNVVKFNGTVATVTAATATSLTVTVPAGATTGAITVLLNGQTATSTSSFTVLQPPTVANFSPASGTVGTSVTITGTNFDTTPANNVVKFNGTIATVTAATTTSLTTTVPPGITTGTISVTVNGQTATSPSPFTLLLPTITNLAPSIAAVGNTVTITGTNFDTTPANNVVTFNGTVATVTAATTTSLTTTVPAGATTGTVTVTVFGQSVTSAAAFTVVSACSGKVDLSISNLVVTQIFNNNELNYEFDLTNIGDVDADLTKVVTQAYASTNADGTGAAAAGGAQIGPYLAPSTLPAGQTAHVAYSSNVVSIGNYDTYIYLIIMINTTLTECSTTNNTAIKSVR